MTRRRLKPLLAAYLLVACSDDPGPELPIIDAPYQVSKESLGAMKRNADWRFTWNTAVKSCRVTMEGQRAIGVFEKLEVTDPQVTSYCNCITDEGMRGRTVEQLASMDLNGETGMCRRYYRPVLQSEIKLAS
jgi:hypothetical protein